METSQLAAFTADQPFASPVHFSSTFRRMYLWTHSLLLVLLHLECGHTTTLSCGFLRINECTQCSSNCCHVTTIEIVPALMLQPCSNQSCMHCESVSQVIHCMEQYSLECRSIYSCTCASFPGCECGLSHRNPSVQVRTPDLVAAAAYIKTWTVKLWCKAHLHAVTHPWCNPKDWPRLGWESLRFDMREYFGLHRRGRLYRRGKRLLKYARLQLPYDWSVADRLAKLNRLSGRGCHIRWIGGVRAQQME